MVKAFKPPLLASHHGASGNGIRRVVSAPSVTSNTTSRSQETDTTFSTINSPPLAIQEEALRDHGQVLRTIGGEVEEELDEINATDSERENARRKKVKQSAVAVMRGRKGTKDIEWVFKTTFKKSHYKGQQEAVMKAALEGIDILVIAPTGMGKSLCFQVPAVAEQHGLTIVVSPLLSLMKDQIAALRALDIPAAMLSSKSSRAEQDVILNDMGSGHPSNRLLYITPERLSSPAFKKRLALLVKQKELRRLVVDEAHCMSEWGHDFRPDYAKIGAFRSEFPQVPIMGLTASATPQVQDDIVAELGLDRSTLLKAIHPFNRMNLFYEVRYFSESNVSADHRREDLVLFIQKLSRGKRGQNPNAVKVNRAAGIIYCRAKKTCDELAGFLRGRGIMAAPYHRGLKDMEADLNQKKWINNDAEDQAGSKVDCIVATIAFGMGIDKGNCSYVVHYDIPKSFEGFYQETGRAGRDGHAARCLLYYSAEDKQRIQSLVSRSHTSRVHRREKSGGVMPSQRAPDSITALLRYAEDVSLCRHLAICRYFGEVIPPTDAHTLCNKMCDVCKDPVKTRKRRNAGLVDLDFAQTQAVVARLDDSGGEGSDVEERNPEDYYPDATMRKKHGSDEEDDVEEEASEEESDEDTRPSSRKPEGFRSAAVERKRELDRETKDQQEASSSFDTALMEPARGRSNDSGSDDMNDLGDSVVALRGESENGDEEDDAVTKVAEMAVEEEVVTMLLESGNKRKIIIEQEEVLEDPASSVEVVERPRKQAKKVLADDTNSEMPPPVISRKSSKPTFETPFLDPAKRSANIVKTSAPSSIDDPITIKYQLDPSNYEKNIPESTRREIVVRFEKYLGRAFLSKHGNRTSAGEEAVWNLLKAASSNHTLRRKILLFTAVEMESDLFWIALTPLGYNQFVTPLSNAVKRLLPTESEDDSLPVPGRDLEVDEIIRALKRTATSLMRGKKKQKDVAVASDSEED